MLRGSASTVNAGLFARYWLLAGVASLALAGLLAVILVVARTPGLSDLPLFSRLFHEALAVHVDLSVLAWFLSIACMFWSIDAGRSSIIEKAALAAFLLGVLLITLSPLDPHSRALMSNYIPVVFSPVFFLGLTLLLAGVGLQLAHYFQAFFGRRAHILGAQEITCFAAALITLVALASFVLSAPRIPFVIQGAQFYDLAFWAGGHVLQNTHSAFVMLSWLLLATTLRPGFRRGGFYYIALTILFLASVSALYALWRYEVTSQEFRLFFTDVVMELGGWGPALTGLWVIGKISPPSRRERAIFSSLVMSLLLFAYGGILGWLITGENVLVPAHYHGAIVGITLAFGGVAYALLPRFGYAEVAGKRLAFWQPVVYGVGQAMHITGLAWSGGYGVLRKTPGALEGGFTAARAAMGLMGLGGLIAIIGGFMFIIAVYRSVRAGERSD
ncbi:MAG: cbb3-type cytochrome c oxidase subunit I [Alphaproteobacteria bacterium]|nr:cbb3-type cytochrome c oxidase subunit I [Alphaproteobacteria bacterium]